LRRRVADGPFGRGSLPHLVDVADSLERRRQRLAEAIAWCALQKLQNNPPESEDVKRRRALGERAANHAFAAHQLEAASPFKWVTRGKVKKMKEEASQMLGEARLHEIRPLSRQLRTPGLAPLATLEVKQTAEQRYAIVEALCEARATLLRETVDSSTRAEINLAGGGLLQYDYDLNVEDGAAAYDSKGFFDDQSAPPWDTWVCYCRESVVSYVPRILCGLAQRGIEVDPVECVRWVDSQLLAETFGL
jgi:hypothetical protein